jgi:nucleotide-binding universal stress UspA family protein
MDDAPVLICYDDSEDARRAIEASAAFFANRHAVVLEIAPPLTAVESYAAIGGMAPDFADMNRSDALSRAEIGAKAARRAGFDAEARADVAAPTWDGVVAVADELDAAVIIIGSRGLTGAQEFVKGSLSHDVAEHAGRPVLIVPPPRHAASR